MWKTKRLVGSGRSRRDVIIPERERDRDNTAGASRSRPGTVTVFRYLEYSINVILNRYGNQGVWDIVDME